MESEASTVSSKALTQQLANLCGCEEVSLYAVTANSRADNIVFTCEVGRHSTEAAVELPSLAKWLRVNGTALLKADTNHVIKDLPAHEREWLDGADVQICVPLVSAGELLGIVCIHDAAKTQPPDHHRVDDINEWARGAAEARRQWLASQHFQRESAAAYRSQQLTTTGQLAASVAHEVRNPLAAVRSIVQLVKDTHPAAERQARLLGDVLEEVDRIDHTVSGLLGLARPHESSAAVCELGVLAADAVRFMETSARRSGVQLHLSIEAVVSVQIDPREFRQVLLNVLLNACEACKPGDTIDVAVGRMARGSIAVNVVQVHDTGAGIPADVLSRIFDPFFTTKTAGSGLGLAVSRELLRKHGGDIQVESQVGTGTSVVLEFPHVESR